MPPTLVSSQFNVPKAYSPPCDVALLDRLGGTNRFAARGDDTGSRGHWRFAMAALLVLTNAAPAHAIPSPDVVVNIFSNAAQIFGLLTLAIGGALFSRRRTTRRGSRRAAAPNAGWGTSRAMLLALGGVVAVSLLANTLQWADAVDTKEKRLSANLVRSSTEAGNAVGDVSLKTLKFSDQIDHPLGMSTAALAELRAGRTVTGGALGKEIEFIDVREPEEWETGSLDGFAHIRYPEVLARAEALREAGKQPVLLCHSGNRSSELCIALNAMGIDCRFVVGGFEKWLAEGRSARMAEGQSLDSLRSLAPFPNDDVLLDTPEVQQLVSEEQAVFVDVRYPKEFGERNLPGAINMPIRKMTSAELDRVFDQLPKRPIIAPCYDKRSCFYSQILGLRLHRKGFDFRGRYTVPDEYFTASAPKPHVQDWLDARDGSVFSVFRQPFDSALSLVFNRTGDLVLAIFVVLVVLRLLLLPFTVKNERDQIVERRIEGRLAALKERLGDDPKRLKSALRALYRENGLTPGRNMFGLFLQIGLLVAFFSAVSAVATPDSGAFLWISDLGMRDPYYILPILLGTMIFLQLQVNAARNSAKRIALRILGAVFFIGLTATLEAALTLYLVFGLALMLLQMFVVRSVVNRGQATGQQSENPMTAQIARLNAANRMSGVGTKAERIATMMAAGIPVPPGIVIPDAVFSGTRSSISFADAHQRQLMRLCKKLRLQKMAVRSSGIGEDGEDHSYAGVFESILNVDRDGLLDAVDTVRQSLLSNGASVYGNDESIGGGVIVQQLVDAEYAGVMFTEHPMHSGAMLIELAAGLGDKIANGTVEPESFVFGRASREPLDRMTAPIELGPLIELGVRAEELFGHAQDIEWAYAKGRFFLLQSRNITSLGRLQPGIAVKGSLDQAVFERERYRLLQIIGAGAAVGDAEESVLAQNELSELLPRPTPLSLSLMESHWRPGGSVDLACRQLGIPYSVEEDAGPYLVSVFGALYLNAPEMRRRSRKSLGPMASFRLSRAADTLERDFFDTFLPTYLTDLRLLDATDFTRIGTNDLICLLDDVWDRYCHDSHVQIDIVNIAADFYVQAAKRELVKRKLSAGAYLGQGAKGIVHHAIMLLQGMRRGVNTPEEFLALFGHRSDIDYELAKPRYRENVGLIEQFVRTAEVMARHEDNDNDTLDLSKDRTLAIAVKRARTFQNLKEIAKHYALRELAVIRRLLLELDRRLELGGGIFYLEIEELREHCRAADTAEMVSIIEERRATARYFDTLPALATSLTLRDVERLTPQGETHRQIERADAMQGILVAGDGEIIGRARVLTDQNTHSVEDGEIVIARYMHPSWAPIFPRIKGIVTEIGGWLSHTSILAREYNITTIIGVKGVEYQVQTGDLLKLSVDGAIEVIERRDDGDGPSEKPITPAAADERADSAGL